MEERGTPWLNCEVFKLTRVYPPPPTKTPLNVIPHITGFYEDIRLQKDEV